ncbi:MAG: FHA domain-containing protein [Magnetococcales bacterium]|nr:FHA domain-containing protein [Magnetococcales bacterium]
MGEKNLDATVFAWGDSAPESGRFDDVDPSGIPNEIKTQYEQAPPCLVVLEAETQDFVFDLTSGENSLGRHPSDSIIVLNRDVSRHHLMLVINDDLSEVVLHRIKSMVTLSVNGVSVQDPVTLTGGETITVGEACTLRFYPKGDVRRYPYDQQQLSNFSTTGCLNKSYFFFRAELLFTRCMVEETQISMLLIETKGLNEPSISDEARETALKSIGDFLQNKAAKVKGLTGHISDTGFSMLLPHVNQSACRDLANMIHAWFETDPLSHDGTTLSVKTAVGYGAKRPNEKKLDDLTQSVAFSLKSSMAKAFH